MNIPRTNYISSAKKSRDGKISFKLEKGRKIETLEMFSDIKTNKQFLSS